MSERTWSMRQKIKGNNSNYAKALEEVRKGGREGRRKRKRKEGRKEEGRKEQSIEYKRHL